MPASRNPIKIKQFLDLMGYYRKFVTHFADIGKPLTTLTGKEVTLDWTPLCQEAFVMLKKNLTENLF